jgi:kumamolisin
MTASAHFHALKDSEHPHPAGALKLHPTSGAEELTVTLLLRRKPGHQVLKPEHMVAAVSHRPTRDVFTKERGAAPEDMAAVIAFAQGAGLTVVESNAARRSVIVRGSAAAINQAFAVQLNDYEYDSKSYRSHDGAVNLPSTISGCVEAVVGLTNRRVPAVHYAAPAAARVALDPLNTAPLTPAQVATLYHFPAGDGHGQTIGLYEMTTQDGPAGYAPADIAATMAALGGLAVPNIIDVPVDGTSNSGQSDGETGLDITVAGAIAPQATIAVYFAGGETQNILHALQMMILPDAGQPAPNIVSISYGFGPDDQGTPSFSDSEYAQFTQLFEDAATNKITVLVSSGDSGALIASKTAAQTSYPASDIWVTACGGTTIGNVSGSSYEEWVWNDRGAGGLGATGGGVSARFAVPAFQTGAAVPVHNSTGKPGRGVPDISGNASENSGYLQVINGSRPQSVGGTSAVAPLYAGLVARINSNLGAPAGYLNTLLYSLAASTFHRIVAPPGPANNDFGGVKGYPATAGWNACTGLGSVNGQALQAAISTAGGGTS